MVRADLEVHAGEGKGQHSGEGKLVNMMIKVKVIILVKVKVIHDPTHKHHIYNN